MTVEEIARGLVPSALVGEPAAKTMVAAVAAALHDVVERCAQIAEKNAFTYTIDTAAEIRAKFGLTEKS